MDVSWNPISEIRKDWKIYLKMLRYCTWILLLLEADKRGVLTAGDARVGGQMLLKGQMSVIPRFSHAKNIGLDGSGINCRYTPMGDGVDLSNCLSDMSFSNIDIDYQIIRALNNKISIPGTSLRAVLEGMGFMHFARKLKKNLIRINNDYLKKR
jgi:hypothetical protein